MSPRPDVSVERTNQIITAAMRVFARMGLHNARMEDIAKEAGLSKGALYLYFESKEEIILSILDLTFAPELNGMDEMIKKYDSMDRQFEALEDQTTASLKRAAPDMAMHYEFYALSFRNEEVRSALQNYFRRFVELSRAMLREGVERGTVREADAPHAAIMMAAITEGTLLLWNTDPDLFDIEEQIQTNFRIFLEGLRYAAEKESHE